ncbi:DUF896 domain-containing protein [Nicoliella spurrieriana]|uniref:UPF0291 protein MOO44_06245 n=1 Tax=Nicoliella spurrieriana TaxID=2925830 RepID=A0A976X579_9LACO|nr:DUF896 domain-containing protein [Nicoliella spurrieriana]UQS86489.1 DUF896 domain-containing protein [Nicoliella spurrieriana]
MAEDKELMKIIPRINELAHKAKKEGLSELEKLEQGKLRKQYLKRFRANFKSQVEMMKVYNDKGEEVTPRKVRDIQRGKGLRDD